MNKKLVFLAVVTLLANRIALGHHVPPAVPVMCGDTIFVDTILNSNLIDCPGNGITIGADNIKLMLNGFIIDGSGAGEGIVLVGRVGVKIKGPGVVREFSHGILIDDGNDNKIKDVVVAANSTSGILTFNSSKNEITGNTGYANGFVGIHIAGGSGNKVMRNDAHDNETGILLSANGNTIYGNNTHTNSNNGISVAGDNNMVKGNQTSEQNTGIWLRPGADGNIIAWNNVTSNPGNGVRSQLNSRNKIKRNVIASSFVGILLLDTMDTVIAKNTFSANADHISDNGLGTVVVGNICDPPDTSPVCN